MVEMKYSREVDALAIVMRAGGRSERTVQVTPGLRIDFDARDRVVQIELLDASVHIPREALDQLPASSVKFTLAEAYAETGITPSTLRVQLNNGRIRGEKAGRDWLIDAASLEEYVASRSPRGRQTSSAKGRRETA